MDRHFCVFFCGSSLPFDAGRGQRPTQQKTRRWRQIEADYVRKYRRTLQKTLQRPPPSKESTGTKGVFKLWGMFFETSRTLGGCFFQMSRWSTFEKNASTKVCSKGVLCQSVHRWSCHKWRRVQLSSPQKTDAIHVPPIFLKSKTILQEHPKNHRIITMRILHSRDARMAIFGCQRMDLQLFRIKIWEPFFFGAGKDGLLLSQ